MNDVARNQARNKRRRDAYAKANRDAEATAKSVALAKEELTKNEKQRVYKARSRTKKHKRDQEDL
jgi:U3 small nucleolar ribonucleoprotein component